MSKTENIEEIINNDNESKENEDKEHHRKLYQQAMNKSNNVEQNSQQPKKITSKVYNLERINKIIKILKGHSSKADANLKHFIKQKELSVEVKNEMEVLYILDKKTKTKKQIAVKENFFEILYAFHTVERGHCGVNKTDVNLKEKYYGIPKHVIVEFIRTCPTCNLKLVQQSQPRLNPIHSDEFCNRFQLDLIDMRHNICLRNGKEYKWIAYVEDHFTKFRIIWPQEEKNAKEIVENLKIRVFSLFGLPNVLQTDNSPEFKNQYLYELVNNWEVCCKIIHDRPRLDNDNLERMLSSFLHQFGKSNWVDYLPNLMFNLNTQNILSSKYTPYELVFGIKCNRGKRKEIKIIEEE